MMAGSDKTCEVGHIDHQQRPDFISDFAETGEINGPGISRTAGDN